MAAATVTFSFSGQVLQRGFWLYVWEIQPPDGRTIYYVGRTGDSSSTNAQSPFNRMSQHLGFNVRSNVLRRRLENLGVRPETCEFRLTTYGPILPEGRTPEEHRRSRDIIAALEKALADAMREAGYNVINSVRCRQELYVHLFFDVREAFAREFPRINTLNIQKR